MCDGMYIGVFVCICMCALMHIHISELDLLDLQCYSLHYHPYVNRNDGRGMCRVYQICDIHSSRWGHIIDLYAANFTLFVVQTV